MNHLKTKNDKLNKKTKDKKDIENEIVKLKNNLDSIK